MKRIIKFMLFAILALPAWAETKTVCEGSASSEFVPVYGYWIDTQGVESQFIYPLAELNLAGGSMYQIDAITFHSTAAVPASLSGATVIVRMGETYNTTISTRSEMVTNRNNMEVVYQGNLAIDSNDPTKMTIEFQTPYPYQGNNLMIDIYIAEPSENCDHCFWLGEILNETTAWNSKNGGESFLPQMTITYSEYHEQVLDFGKIAKGTSTTATVTVANSANATVEPLKAPFSIESRSGDTFTIKFAPTDAASYTDHLVVNINGKNTTVRVTGIGTGASGDGPVATRDEAFFKNITYTWKDHAGTAHTSNLSEIATDPDQIIAMLKEVYTNQSIPGNYFRSNEKRTADTYNDVLYTGVGKISRGPSIGYATNQVLDIANYASISDAGATVSGMSTIYKYTNSWLTLSCYGAYQARNNQSWIEGSNLSAPNNGYTWAANDIFQGSSAYFTNSSYPLRSTGSLTFYVTNCTEVRAYVPGGRTDRYATLSVQEYEFSADGNLTAVATATSTNGYNTILTLNNLDETKIYRVQLTGSSGNSTYVRLCEIGFKAGSLTNEYSDNEYVYVDSYGWDIPGTIETNSNNSHFKFDEYKPDEEGVTLLLVEMVDTFTSVTVTSPEHNYAQLRDYVKNSMKSARVVTEAKRTGTASDYSSGTLFKIDCDKMNNFFLLAKGQLMEYYGNGGSYGYPNYNSDSYHDNYLSSSYLDKEPALFCHMFEQFSPAQTSATGNPIDVYQELIKGDSFPVVHDCPCVPYCYGTGGGHYFSMYHSDYSGDCADVRDMMFFVPDYRMMYHSNRTGGNSDAEYFIYNTSHAPTMGLYVITQDPITGNQVTGKDMYQLTLTWNSNLDKFLPSDQQEYQLYQVVLDEYGTEQYVPVYYMNSDGQYLSGPNGSVVSTPVPVVLTLNPTDAKTYTEVYIPMLESSQQVTFAIRGQDATHFLDLKTSNTRDFVIPGLDPNELVELTDATHYSRFNPQTVKNCYSNKIAIANTAMGLVNDNINSETKLTVVRSRAETVDGETTTVSEPIAEITFNKANNRYTITMLNQSAKSEYPNGKESGQGAGYHANGPSHNIEGNGNWQQSYTVNSGGYVNFGSLELYDNFVVSVADNSHPNGYSYQMTSNYQGTPSSIYLYIGYAASALQEGGAVFYACTWNTGQPQKWVKGESMNEDNTLFRFSLLKDNVIFCRMNPAVEEDGNEPGWDFRWNQSGDKTTSGNLGKTYYVWSDDPYNFVGDWDNNTITPEYAHSNTFRVPVFKTDSKINNVYTLEEVDSEKEATAGDDFENDDLTFEEKLQYSSKKTILRYDVYRWGETEDRYIVNKVTGKDNEEEDLSPNGQADNQDGWYTTKMNAESQESVTVPDGSTDKWASFLDNVPENTQNAEAFTYAPVVETFSIGKTSNNANQDRTDYNTYGGPLQNASIGKLTISADKPVMSDYSWTKDGKKYAYYTITLNVNTKDIPDDYEIYKIRVWREADKSVLGEEYPELASRVSSRYKFEEIKYTETDKIGRFWQDLKFGIDEVQATVTGPEGSKTVTYNLGTFGARKVETGVFESFNVGYFARIYFTRAANLPTPNQGEPSVLRANGEPLPADGKFYMVEAECNYSITPENVITAVNDIGAAKQIVGVSYVNTIGQVSSTPWQGVNVVVTRYSDGSVSTQKMMK